MFGAGGKTGCSAEQRGKIILLLLVLMAKDTEGLCCYQGTLLACAQLVVHQYLKSFLAEFLCNQSVSLPDPVSYKEHDSAFVFAEPDEPSLSSPSRAL